MWCSANSCITYQYYTLTLDVARREGEAQCDRRCIHDNAAIRTVEIFSSFQCVASRGSVVQFKIVITCEIKLF